MHQNSPPHECVEELLKIVSPEEELLQITKEYTSCTPTQRLEQLLELKRNNNKRKIALYAMIVYKDILAQRTQK